MSVARWPGTRFGPVIQIGRPMTDTPCEFEWDCAVWGGEIPEPPAADLLEPFDNFTDNGWALNGTPTIVAGRTGTAATVTGSSTYVAYNIPAPERSDILTVGFAWRWNDAITSSRDIVQFRGDAGASFHTRLRANPTTGAVSVEHASTAVLGTSAASLVARNTWAYIEVQTKLAEAPDGFVAVRVNGVEVINATGVDTRNAGAVATYDQVRLINALGSSTALWDDLYMTFGPGGVFLGDITLPLAATRIPVEDPGRWGPWWDWQSVECDVAAGSNVVRGTSSPSQRPSSSTASLTLVPRDNTLAPWYVDPATGERPNRGNLPLRVGVKNLAVDASTRTPRTTPTADLFEPFDALTAWTAGLSHSLVAGRTGTALQVTATNQSTTPTPTANATITVGFAFTVSAVGASIRPVLQLRAAGAVNLITVTVDLTGGLQIRQGGTGGTVLGTAAAVVTIDTWYYAELRVTAANTPTGAATLRINGTEVLNLASVDTLPGADPLITTLALMGPGTTGTHKFDDLYLTMGSAGAFLGDITLPFPEPPEPSAVVDEWWLFTGWVDYLTEVDSPDELSLTIVGSDGFKHLSNLDQEELAAQGAGEAAGARIARILDRAGWMNPRDLSLGTFALQATTLAQPALEEIFLVADTEAGGVWVDTAGAFRFVDRDWLRSKGERVDWRIGDRTADPDAICASSIVSTADDMDVQNVIGISRVGGVASWVTDADSVAKYGRHSWSRFDLPYADDADTATILSIQLADRTARDYHVQAVVLSPLSEPSAWDCCVAVELFDTVYITRQRGSELLAEAASVIGIDHSFGPGEFVTVLSLGPRIRQTLARWDVDVWDAARWSGT